MSSFKPCRIIFPGDGHSLFLSQRSAFPMSLTFDLHGTREQIRRVTDNPADETVTVRVDKTEHEPACELSPEKRLAHTIALIGYIYQEPEKKIRISLNLVSGRGKIERI